MDLSTDELALIREALQALQITAAKDATETREKLLAREALLDRVSTNDADWALAQAMRAHDERAVQVRQTAILTSLKAQHQVMGEIVTVLTALADLIDSSPANALARSALSTANRMNSTVEQMLSLLDCGDD